MVDARDPLRGTETEGDAPTGKAAGEFLSAGQLLGERYQVRRLLGAGGMGEVWQAFDLKLQVEVALKALRADIFADDRRIEGLRREVRAAREVVSPNVCRIFDLEEVAGHELVSMEYVDGSTLLEVLRERGPLALKEAQDVASQLLAGLEAIHAAGLVHRDIKPENIMLTRTGRVVVMDFGIARGQEEGAGTVSGTPAYMSPEQGRGGSVDARSDLYAAGVVLAEMVSPEGVKDRDSRESLWEGMRQDPPRIADTPWAPVLRRAVAHDPDMRYDSAHTLTRALEEITLRVEGAEDLNPYPGLAAFTEDDCEYFFGREAEVEQMWRRLEGPARLLALVGPSGAGKTSFLRAGLIPSAGAGWGIVRCTPGDAAFASLRRAVIPELAGDVEALEQLAAGDEAATAQAFARWRQHHDRALLIVDQFEELFTQNSENEQRRVASVLGRLVLEADTHVLLGMRDDFLYRCHEHDELRPITSELTLLGPPVGPALRRAVVQPAAKCGYRFEDDQLVDEMLAEVEGERGALPLLAFAMARVWERRDRQEGLLTREAYGQVGGVEGALAQHAERTLEEIGASRLPIVRELFRNLVTAERTRAVRGWDELLSVFEDREAAKKVLRALIDARLLNSYEVDDEDGTSHRRVEIVHESLLTSWPRLVRWQTQDADAAQVRDQLRQAARTWADQGRSDDTLWTGSAYREFAVWRENYPGGLSETEEAFAEAMTSLAARRRRRRRLAVASAGVVLVTVLVVVTTLWRSSVAETRRAEAGKLLALGQMQLEDDPTAALAYARASLELADTLEARRFAVEVLWRGPVARVLPVARTAREAGLADVPSVMGTRVLSPDGRWLATLGEGKGRVLLFPRDGGPPRALPQQPDGNVSLLAFGPRGEVLVTGGSGSSMRFWSLPELEEIRTVELGGLGSVGVAADDRRLLTFTRTDDEGELVRVWPLPDGEAEIVGDPVFQSDLWDFDPASALVAHRRGREVLLTSLGPAGGSKERVVGEAGDVVVDVELDPGGERVASLDRSGEIRVWTTAEDVTGPLHAFQGPRYDFRHTRFDPTGRYVTQLGPNTTYLLWDLDGPPGTEPRVLRRRVPGGGWSCDFDPRGRWAVTDFEEDTIEFWSLEMPWVRTFRDVSSSIWSMAFTGDERWLAVCPIFQPARLWPLNAEHGSPRNLVPPEPCAVVATHPAREEILVETTRGEMLLYPVPGGTPRRLPEGFKGVGDVSFDPEGRRVIGVPIRARSGIDDPEQRVLAVWDLETGQPQVYSVAHLTDADWTGAPGIGFGHDGSVYATLGKGANLMRVTLPAEPGGEISAETVVAAGSLWPLLSRDGRFLIVHATDESLHSHARFRYERLVVFDLVEGTSRRITTHGTRLTKVTQIDPAGRILVTGDIDGVVRAGPLTGEEPHLLLGHQGFILSLAISADGRWIASADDESVRLWPMPDVTMPPLHTLPHDELLATLDEFTNLRAVRDEESATGWTLEIGPFPGWETVPER